MFDDEKYYAIRTVLMESSEGFRYTELHRKANSHVKMGRESFNIRLKKLIGIGEIEEYTDSEGHKRYRTKFETPSQKLFQQIVEELKNEGLMPDVKELSSLKDRTERFIRIDGSYSFLIHKYQKALVYEIYATIRGDKELLHQVKQVKERIIEQCVNILKLLGQFDGKEIDTFVSWQYNRLGDKPYILTVEQHRDFNKPLPPKTKEEIESEERAGKNIIKLMLLANSGKIKVGMKKELKRIKDPTKRKELQEGLKLFEQADKLDVLVDKLLES